VPVLDKGWDGCEALEPGSERTPVAGYNTKRNYRSTRSGGIRPLVRFLVFAGVVSTLVLGGLFFFARPVVVGAISDWGAENPTALKIPFVADLIRMDLGDDLTEPVDRNDTTPVTFMIAPGETTSQIGDALFEAGLIRSARAFVFESLQKDATSEFMAGRHTLTKSMTIDEMIVALTTSPVTPPTIEIRFREGLRIEQMVAKLEVIEANPTDPQAKLTLDVQRFYDLAKHPSAEVIARYPWLKVPEGGSLEGFLFPATWTVSPNITADELIGMLLDAFAANAPAGLLALKPDEIYAKVQIASLVETEAQVASERPLIAGVYVNRLNPAKWPTGLLDADPTLNYANDSMWLDSHPMSQWVEYVFWTRIQADHLGEVVFPGDLAGYNTYHYPGLPPSPICSPGLASLEAALAPNTSTGYLFFLAKNDKSGTHAFAKTQAEHDANARKYGY
jgi:UPF0755 protein